MRCQPRLGPVNLVLLALYFAPIWGIDAMRALMSPFSGLDDPAHAAAAIYVGRLFDLRFDGLMLTANVLAGIKLVIAAGFLAYVIEFARALAVGRDVDRATLDVVLMAAVGAILVWAMPALAFDDDHDHGAGNERKLRREPEATRQALTQSQGLAA